MNAEELVFELTALSVLIHENSCDSWIQAQQRGSEVQVHEWHEFARINAVDLIFKSMGLFVLIRENSSDSWIQAQQRGSGVQIHE
ncbi:MAG UNVERIFIED_CONTAM: hypothetical protein LVR18_21625 [Planctomycetaceae bacterium]|jgi:hypothetical protein